MDSRLFQHERRGLIVTLVNQEGRVSVADLCARFGLSAATIRSDLDGLVRQGLVIRTHGGAITADHRNVEMSFEARRRLYAAEKARIGAAAAAMIADGETIVLDASTTALAVANAIRGHRELTVLTNGLYIALALLHVPGVTVLVGLVWGGWITYDRIRPPAAAAGRARARARGFRHRRVGTQLGRIRQRGGPRRRHHGRRARALD